MVMKGEAREASARRPGRKDEGFPQHLPPTERRLLDPQQSFLSLDREDWLKGLSVDRMVSISGNKGVVKAKGVSWELDDRPEGSFHLKSKVTYEGSMSTSDVKCSPLRVLVFPSGTTVIFPEGIIIFAGATAFLLRTMIFTPEVSGSRCPEVIVICSGVTGVMVFSPGVSVFPCRTTVCFTKDAAPLVGVTIPPLGIVVIFSVFLWVSVATPSPPESKIPETVGSALVTVSLPGPVLEEFIADEGQNFGERVELDSTENHQKKMRVLPLPSHPITTSRATTTPGLLPKSKIGGSHHAHT